MRVGIETRVWNGGAMHRILLAGIAISTVSIPVFVPAVSPARTTPRRCAAADLAGHVVQKGGAAGTIYETIVLRNTSGSACRVYGYPGLGLESAAHHGLAGDASFDRSVAPHRGVLRPGASARAAMHYGDMPVGSETRCPTAHWLLVTPPDTRTSLRIRTTLAPCDAGRMVVGPLRAAA
jgi:hypothetical protein